MSSRWILRIRSHVIVRRPPIGWNLSFYPSRCRFPRGLSMWGSPIAGQGGVMKSSSCTSLVFIRIPLRIVPPLQGGTIFRP